MDDFPEVKIWRYMDLAKFISLIDTESIYFACMSEFNDPFEGFLPRSHIKAEEKILHNVILEPIVQIKNKLAKNFPDSINIRKLDEKIGSISLLETSIKVNRKFGVSCWHKSKHESEAMWKLHSDSGQCIAIESNINQLRNSLGNVKGLIIDSVRYMDFENDPIEKGHKHYRGFVKRKSFEHEKELRATFLLTEEGQGCFVKCNLNTLITKIHVSPLSPAYFHSVVEAICSGSIQHLKKPVIPSKLFSNPDYGIKSGGDISP